MHASIVMRQNWISQSAPECTHKHTLQSPLPTTIHGGVHPYRSLNLPPAHDEIVRSLSRCQQRNCMRWGRDSPDATRRVWHTTRRACVRWFMMRTICRRRAVTHWSVLHDDDDACGSCARILCYSQRPARARLECVYAAYRDEIGSWGRMEVNCSSERKKESRCRPYCGGGVLCTLTTTWIDTIRSAFLPINAFVWMNQT